MSKSIHERVRATLAKQEAAKKRKEQRSQDAAWRRMERADAKLDAEIELRIANGEEFDTDLGEWI